MARSIVEQAPQGGVVGSSILPLGTIQSQTIAKIV